MKMTMDDFSSSSSLLSQLTQFSSARIKLEDLFQQFIKAEGADNLLTVINESIAFHGLDEYDKDKYYGGETGKAFASSSSAAAGGSSAANQQAVRLMLKRSPKKRTQSEMSAYNNGVNSNTASSGVGSTSTASIGATSNNNKATSPVTNSAKELSSLSLDNNNTLAGVANNLFDTNKSDIDAAKAGKEGERGIADQEDDHTAMRRRAAFDKIPPFYFPGCRKTFTQQNYHLEDDQLAKRLPEIEAFFKPFPGGIPVEKFVHVTKRLCGIPSFFNLPLCRRINERYGDADAGIPAPRTIGRAGRQPSGVKIKLKAFLKFWQSEVEPFDRIERFFRIIKKHDADFIVKDDFIPFLQELLHFHPGLDFLEAHEEFQRKYALTVITRIFYKVNTSRSGKIDLREVRKSNLFSACMHVDEETDINKVLDYFSYEHFYVIYCKFFELDTDKDSKLTKHDLMKYGEHALSETIVDRIFQVGVRVFTDGQIGGFEDGGMTYPDFIFFMLSEEDKTTDGSLQYWFRCCDLDGDGKLSPEEMRYFYRNQIHRITSLGQESINFQDVLCQMMDMVSPVNPTAITIEDLTRLDKRMISGK